MSYAAAEEKFFEILERHGISPDDIDKMSVVMHGRPGHPSTITFHGVANPIPPKIAFELGSEVCPLLRQAGFEVVFSDKVLKPGEPRSIMVNAAIDCVAMDDSGEWPHRLV